MSLRDGNQRFVEELRTPLRRGFGLGLGVPPAEGLLVDARQIQDIETHDQGLPAQIHRRPQGGGTASSEVVAERRAIATGQFNHLILHGFGPGDPQTCDRQIRTIPPLPQWGQHPIPGSRVTPHGFGESRMPSSSPPL